MLLPQTHFQKTLDWVLVKMQDLFFWGKCPCSCVEHGAGYGEDWAAFDNGNLVVAECGEEPSS